MFSLKKYYLVMRNANIKFNHKNNTKYGFTKEENMF